MLLSPSTIYHVLAVPRYWPAAELFVRSLKGLVAMSGILTLTEWRWLGTHTLRHFSLIAFTAVLDYYRSAP